MKVGVTGTRNGFTDAQLNAFQLEFNKLNSEKQIESYHQGQCIGVDVDSVHWIRTAHEAVKIHSHPPVKTDLIGECHVDVVHESKTYFARNRDIADTSDILIACPPTEEEQSNGGTWYTFRYGVNKGYKVILITPNGVVTYHNFH